MSNILTLKQAILQIAGEHFKRYMVPIYGAVNREPQYLQTIPGFLIKPEQVTYYLGATHLGIEYSGPERLEKLPSPEQHYQLQIRYFDYSEDKRSFLDNVIGFDHSKGGLSMPLPLLSDGLVCPTNAGFDKLQQLKWNLAAQNMVLTFNTGFEVQEGQFSRVIDSRFFDSDDSGLRTRHIKWLDLIPLKYDNSKQDGDSFDIPFGLFDKLAKVDYKIEYEVPDDFKFQKLPLINRFVELIGSSKSSETEITSFLAQKAHQFIMLMRFSAAGLHAEKECVWQNAESPPIRPDFFVEGVDGYANIVEFKLPFIKNSAVVGSENRETFSAELNSYIAQTRVYREYFDDPQNRKWIKEKYGFDVYKPKRYLVIGRRTDFKSDEWRAIAADYADLNLLTYDDLIDGVVVQFYN